MTGDTKMSVYIHLYALQYNDVALAGAMLDKAVCGQRLGCLGDIACTSATGIRQCANKGFIASALGKNMVVTCGNVFVKTRNHEMTERVSKISVEGYI